jgi:hypothetical protein
VSALNERLAIAMAVGLPVREAVDNEGPEGAIAFDQRRRLEPRN